MIFSQSLCGLLCSTSWALYGLIIEDGFVMMPNGMLSAIFPLETPLFIPKIEIIFCNFIFVFCDSSVVVYVIDFKPSPVNRSSTHKLSQKTKKCN